MALNNKSAMMWNPEYKELGFALLLLDRMFPSLQTFSQESHFDISVFLRARDAAWQALLGMEIPNRLIQECTEGILDTESFTHKLTSQALNAILALIEILEFVSDGAGCHISQVKALAKDSIAMHIDYLDKGMISVPLEEITDNPLMKAEEVREQNDVIFLSSLPNAPDDKLIEILKRRAREQSNLLDVSTRD